DGVVGKRGKAIPRTARGGDGDGAGGAGAGAAARRTGRPRGLFRAVPDRVPSPPASRSNPREHPPARPAAHPAHSGAARLPLGPRRGGVTLRPRPSTGGGPPP